MVNAGAAMNDLFGQGGSKPKKDMKLISDVAFGRTNETKVYGQASILYTAGKIRSVKNVLLPDGSRSSDLHRGTPEAGDWYYQDENGHCIFGHLRIREDDVVFAQRLDQPRPFAFPATSLPGHLISRSNACELARDDDFALKLYAALCAGTWVMTGRRWQGSWDKAARTVAVMRGLNEPYTKFLLGDADESDVSDPEIIDLMEGLGWVLERLDHEEDKRQRAERTQRAINLLDACERKDIVEVPDWFMPTITAVRPGNPDESLLLRLNLTAFSGQMSFQEYVKFWELCDPIVLNGEDEEGDDD